MKKEEIKFSKKEREFIVGLLEYRILSLEYWSQKERDDELKRAKKLAKKFSSKNLS